MSSSAPAPPRPGLWEYAPAPESMRPEIAPRQGHFIGGKWPAPKTGRVLPVINPATGETLSEVAVGSAGDVDRAVQAARTAMASWSALPGAERGKYLFRLSRLIQEKSRALAVLESLQSGHPIRESRDFHLPLVAAHFFHHAGWADKLDFAFPGRQPQPIGVCGQIIPWNFSLLMAAWKLAPALACGNTVVLKPAATAPLTALALARLCAEAGLPAGVVNIVTGPAATGQALVRHPDIDAIAFAGSNATGKLIATTTASTEKRLSLALRGSTVHIIMDDAPLDQAVDGIIAGVLTTHGHAGSAGSRLLVQEGVAATVIRKLERRLLHLRVGDPLDKNTDVGAVHSQARLEKIRALVDGAVADGARMIQTPGPLPNRGFWFAPTLLDGVTTSHHITREEIAGPVLPVMTFRTPEEALQLANNSPQGLGAGIWTEKGSRMLKMASALRAGVVWANSCHAFDPASPFGGLRESGFGRDGGRQGLADWVTC